MGSTVFQLHQNLQIDGEREPQCDMSARRYGIPGFHEVRRVLTILHSLRWVDVGVN